jgi:hypothetical protein
VTGTNSNLTILNCSLSRNIAVVPAGLNSSINYGGGAVTVIGTNATAVISNSVFEQNSAEYAAAIYSGVGAVVLLQQVSTAGTR